MEATVEGEYVIPVKQGSPGDKIPNLVAKKTTLRQVLLRAEHYRDFMVKCQQQNITPRGRQFNREVYFM